MTIQITNLSPKIYAKIAGFLYLIIIVFGISSELIIRSSLIVTGDASATADNIMASQTLFRLGFVFDSIMLLADVSIAIIFYMLLKPVSKILSLLAAVFRLLQAAILGANLLNYFAAFLLLSNTEYLSAFGTEHLNSLAMFFLSLHSHGYDLALIFFGASNLIMGYLLIKSKYVPVIFGYGLIGTALVYLLGSYSRFIFPEYLSYLVPIYIIPLIAEFSFCLWLLVKGMKIQT